MFYYILHTQGEFKKDFEKRNCPIYLVNFKMLLMVSADVGFQVETDKRIVETKILHVSESLGSSH